MRKARLVVVLALLYPLSLLAGERSDWIDLTHELSEDSIFWPTANRFEKVTDFEGHTKQGFYYSAYSFTTAEHGGTHIDAPIHFAEGKRHVDEIPLEQLIGHAVVIDVTDAAAKDRDYLVSIEDMQNWEGIHGPIPQQAIVLLRTGFGAFWPDAERYLGTGNRGTEAVAELSFPGLDPAAATWLVAQRNVKAVGIDTASIDRGKSKYFKAHVELMTHNIPAFENVANLGQLPATGAWVVALPVKLKGGSGGPLRIVARIGAP
jgi:kynurenine formamidase